MAAKGMGLSVLLIFLLLAFSEALAQAPAGKKELALLQGKENGAITEAAEAQWIGECVISLVRSTECFAEIVDAALYDNIDLSRNCCELLFVEIGTDCVFSAIRFLYPFRNGLGKLIQLFCARF